MSAAIWNGDWLHLLQLQLHILRTNLIVLDYINGCLSAGCFLYLAKTRFLIFGGYFTNVSYGMEIFIDGLAEIK